jgi:hypothetical protein
VWVGGCGCVCGVVCVCGSTNFNSHTELIIPGGLQVCSLGVGAARWCEYIVNPVFAK